MYDMLNCLLIVAARDELLVAQYSAVLTVTLCFSEPLYYLSSAREREKGLNQ